MTETRRISDEYTTMAQRLIDEDDALAHIRESDVQIIYLASNKPKKSKGKFVFGECERVADKNKWAIPADFTVTIYDPNCIGMDEEHLFLAFGNAIADGRLAADEHDDGYGKGGP